MNTTNMLGFVLTARGIALEEPGGRRKQIGLPGQRIEDDGDEGPERSSDEDLESVMEGESVCEEGMQCVWYGDGDWERNEKRRQQREGLHKEISELMERTGT